MVEKSFKIFVDEVRRTDAYWLERAKIDFAEDLSRLMDRRGVSRSQLAQRIESSAAYITKALRGDTNFTIESMVKLVRALDGTLRLHVSGAEDQSRWIDVLELSGAQCAAPSFEATAFRPASKVQLHFDMDAGIVSDGSVTLAA